MKSLLIAALFVLLRAINTNAQSSKIDSPRVFSNTVGVATGVMIFPGHGSNLSYGIFTSQVSCTYERVIYKGLSLSASFAIWDIKGRDLMQANIVDEDKGHNYGDLAKRVSYKTFDIVPEYKLHTHNYKNVVTFGLGAAYTFGQNKYYKPVIYGPNSYLESNDQLTYNTTNAGYFGTVSKVAYTRFFFSNRLGLGAEAYYRYYFGLNDQEIDLNATLKFCF